MSHGLGETKLKNKYGIKKFLIVLVFFSISGNAISNSFYLNTGLEKKEVFDFYEIIKSIIETEQKELLSNLVSYPLTVYENDNNLLVIENSDDFVKNYNKIITERVKYTVACTGIDDLWSNSNGIMLADGVIWFSSVKDKDSDPWRTLITSINNKERKKGLWYKCK